MAHHKRRDRLRRKKGLTVLDYGTLQQLEQYSERQQFAGLYQEPLSVGCRKLL